MVDLLATLHIGGTVVILLLSVPAVCTICSFLTRSDYHQPLNTCYQDEDGEASEDSQQATAWVTRRLAILLTVIYIALALLKASLSWTGLAQTQSSPIQNGLILIIGVALLTQALSLNIEPGLTVRYRLGLKGAWSWLVAGVICLASTYEAFRRDLLTRGEGLLGVCTTLVILSGIGLCLSLPRRPDIFHHDRPVDRQFTTSILGRVTFAWASDIVPTVKSKGNTLSVEDVPELAHHARAETLRDGFRATRANGMGLWRAIFYLHRGVLIRQMIVTVIIAFLSILPSLALFEVLQALENPDVSRVRLWVNVALLALGVLFSATLDTWKVWFSLNCLSLRVYEQLSLAVFEKSTRIPTTCTFSDDAAEQSGDTMNLLAVDAKYVAECVSNSYIMYKAPLQLIISGTYLTHLLGWQSVVASVLVMALVTPVNIYAARKYTSSQQSLMTARDRKMQVLSEALQLIRQIKFAAQESRWEDIINQGREAEVRAQWTVFVWEILQIAIYLTSPVILSVVCLGTYALVYETLSAPTAFAAIAVLNSIELVMYALPECVARTATGMASMKRIQRHLESRERPSRTDSATTIEFVDATLGWASSRSVEPVLYGVTLCFPPSGLSLVTGPTGCGKSLLLASILGESALLGDTVKSPRDAVYAYVAQVPWLENASIKDNILFGSPLDNSRYDEVLFACALRQDLSLFPDRDATEVGPSGVNLSGGQKWRLSLARALYSPANVLIMDDIFSAVDVHTARHLYDHALTGPLANGRTRILVTHHVSLCLPRTDYIVSLNHGSVQYAGPVSKMGADLEQSKTSPHLDNRQPEKVETSDCQPDSAPSQFVQDEHRQEGSTQWRVWKTYITMGGSVFPWIWVIVVFGGYSMVLTARAWWLHLWSGRDKDPSFSPHLFFYLGIYIGLGVLACVIGALRSYFALQTSLRVARGLFAGLLHTILHTPLRWLDVVPPGRILNRFVADVLVVDSLLGDDIQSTLANAFDVALAILAGSIVSPWLVFPALILCLICVSYGRIYLGTAREIRRLESVVKSPIFEQVRISLSGLWTIRAGGRAGIYVDKVTEHVDRYARAYWQLWLLNCWLGFRMDVLGAVFAVTASILVVSAPSVDASLAGFAICFTLEMAQSMSLTVRRYASLELSMNSVERILEYSDVPTEPINEGIDIPADWPSRGCIQVSNLCVRYAANLSPALNDISFTVGSAQRVGVVGRTGSGKSTLILALFRFLEASEGSIFIDGVDISSMKLQQLRQRLAIVPQNPAVFSGTVRSNLDPFGQHSDDELLAALRAVQWDDGLSCPSNGPDNDTPDETDKPIPDTDSQRPNSIDESSIPLITIHPKNTTPTTTTQPSSPPSPLDHPIAADGQNLSQGRRQLLCLARAMTQRPKLLVLDEATSGIDEATDTQIQASIRRISKQNEMSLLVVAHRLSTVVDFDRILVLRDGCVAEFGNPQELVQRRDGLFRAMVMEHGGMDELRGSR